MASEDLSKLFQGLSLKNKEDIYILLLGQKSTGKSTFINALSNCLIFDKLKNAKEDLVRVLLPCRLSIKDKSSACHLVRIGTEDEIDVNDSGAFSTKQIRTYVIPLNQNGSSKLHIIDTPGFDGPYGFDQDKRLCDDILTYIAPLKEVHAICWFLSATDLNVSSFFDYCIKIILPRIDKRSYESLVFCFTKTQDFTSGEAWLNLEKAVNEFNGSSDSKVKWSTSHDNENNVFSFENDFFRYLAGIKLGYPMDTTIHSRSWEHTTREMKRMLSYVLDKSKTIPLKNASCLNEGRRLITEISQPIFDTLQFIQEQMSILEIHKRELMLGSECLADLKEKLYLPIVNLEAMSTGHPYLVCSSNKCLQFCMDWGTSRWEMPKEKCHDKCYLPRSPSHMVGGPELMECEQINKTLQLCTKCTCHFSLHLHLYYSLKWSLKKVPCTTPDQVTPTEILSALEKLNEVIDKLINVYTQQKRDIVVNLAQFAHFMEATSVTPYQCCYDDYIQSLIHRVENVLLMPNSDAKKHLLNLQSIFREKKADYDTALSLQRRLNNDSNFLTSITPQKIMENVVKLYNLGEVGQKIRQLMKIQKTARQKEHEQSIVNLLLSNKKVQKDKSNEEKQDKKKNNDEKKGTPPADCDQASNTRNSSDIAGLTVVKKNAKVNQKNSDKPEEGKFNKNPQNKNKNKQKSVNNEKTKVKKPLNTDEATTSTATSSKQGSVTKPFQKQKQNFHPKVSPPSYESVINQELFNRNHSGLNNPTRVHPNLPDMLPAGANTQSQPIIQVKVFNTPHSASDISVHGPTPHSSEFLPPQHVPHQANWPPYGQGPVAHGSVLHGPGSHGFMPHGSMPMQGFPQHNWGHLHLAHSDGHSPHRYYGHQSTSQQGHRKPNIQESFRLPIGFGKDKQSKDKKEHNKFKRDCKKKVQKGKPKKNEQVQQKVKSDSSSSSSSDTD